MTGSSRGNRIRERAWTDGNIMGGGQWAGKPKRKAFLVGPFTGVLICTLITSSSLLPGGAVKVLLTGVSGSKFAKLTRVGGTG
jgi:hypothetical protein